jgi:hypothetical protein
MRFLILCIAPALISLGVWAGPGASPAAAQQWGWGGYPYYANPYYASAYYTNLNYYRNYGYYSPYYAYTYPGYGYDYGAYWNAYPTFNPGGQPGVVRYGYYTPYAYYPGFYYYPRTSFYYYP